MNHTLAQDLHLVRAARVKARTPDVSIITACRNGAATLPRMFESLQRQRCRAWESIVVDDGSTDASRDIVQAYGRRDPRVRLLSQAHAGASAARNRGIAAAAAGWILFLDCDDWLAPNALGILLEAARRHAAAGVVVGRAIGVLPDGRRRRLATCDLSEPFAFLCAEGRLAIHSVLVRRDLVAAPSGFDPDLKTHEDWDLWQRLARSGATFVEAPSDVAFFRPRPDSLSRDVRQTTVDGLRVLRRGHAPDPRVRTPAPAHAQGASPDALPSRELQFLMWSAARDIASGGDGLDLLALAEFEETHLDPPFLGALMGAGMADVAICDPGELGRRWCELEPKLAALFAALPGAERQPRLMALTLATIRAHLDGEAPGADDVRLDQPDPLHQCIGGQPPSVLHLKGPRGALAIATPALAPLGRKALERTILAQARRLPLRAAVRALAPWRSLAFHLAAARRLADPRGLGLAGVDAGRLKALARLRLRSAISAGLHAALGERLVGGRDGADGACPHTEALNALDVQATTRAMSLPALARERPRRKPARRAPGEIRTSIPILTYHRVAPDGPKRLAPYRVTPDRFAQQIRHLRNEGFRSVEPEELFQALSTNRPLRGRPVMLTFDDGYADFAEHAWPVLKDCGFGAVLFVVPDKVGACADWDARYGDPAPLLDWPGIAALARDGVSIESHSASHRPLPSLETEPLYWEALSSAAAIERVVGRRPMAFSYPFGALDPVVERVVEECGYRLGFTTTPGVCSLGADPLRLSRVEMAEADDAASIGRKLREA